MSSVDNGIHMSKINTAIKNVINIGKERKDSTVLHHNGWCQNNGVNRQSWKSIRLSNNTRPVVPFRVKRAVIRGGIQIAHGITISMFIIVKVVIEDSGIPIKVQSEGDVW
jgi:hypothetical protein